MPRIRSKSRALAVSASSAAAELVGVSVASSGKRRARSARAGPMTCSASGGSSPWKRVRKASLKGANGNAELPSWRQPTDEDPRRVLPGTHRELGQQARLADARRRHPGGRSGSPPSGPVPRPLRGAPVLLGGRRRPGWRPAGPWSARPRRGHEAVPDGCGSGSPAAGHPEFVEDMGDVDRGRLLADEEGLPDLAVRAAIHEEGEDLTLAGGEAGGVGGPGGGLDLRSRCLLQVDAGPPCQRLDLLAHGCRTEFGR